MKLNKALIQANLLLFQEFQRSNTELKVKIDQSLERFKNNSASIQDVLQIYNFFTLVWEQPMIHLEVAEELEKLIEFAHPRLHSILDKWFVDIKEQIKNIKEQE